MFPNKSIAPSATVGSFVATTAIYEHCSLLGHHAQVVPTANLYDQARKSGALDLRSICWFRVGIRDDILVQCYIQAETA